MTYEEMRRFCCDSNTHIKNTGRRKSPEKSNCLFNSLFDRKHNSDLSCGGSVSHNCDLYKMFRERDRNHYYSSSFSSECSSSRGSSSDSHKNNPEPIHQSRVWLYMTVWISSVFSYINGLTGDFVHDDISAITSNPDVTGANSLYQTFLNDYWGKPLSHPLSHKSYRPFTILTFRFTHSLVGLSPVWFHLGNVVLHSLVCLLYCRMLSKLLRAKASLIPSLLFALHPVHTEAVSGNVGRADLLAGTCLLLALLAYHNGLSSNHMGSKNSTWQSVRWSVLWTFVGTLCKEQAITALCVCCVWDICVHQNLIFSYCKYLKSQYSTESQVSKTVLTNENLNLSNNNNFLCECYHQFVPDCQQPSYFQSQAAPKIYNRNRSPSCNKYNFNCCAAKLNSLLRRISTLTITGFLILSFRLWMLRGSSPAFSDQDNPASFSSHFTTRLLTFLHLPALNFWLLICPDKLSHDWQLGSVPLITSGLDYRNAFSALFYATLIALAYKAFVSKGNEGRMLRIGLALLVIPFLPATNLFFRVGFVIAERIIYIPSMGYCLIVGLGLHKLARGKVFLVLFLLMVFSAKTIRRNSDWKNRESLFISGLKTMPHNAKMHYNYANLQRDWSNVDTAIAHYREAIRLWPDHASAHNNLATLLVEHSEAEFHYHQALEAHPQHVHASYNLARLKLEQGEKEEAIKLLRNSLEWDPLYKDAVSVLAEIYASNGREKEADTLHRELLSVSHYDADAHNNYAAFLERTGRKEAALGHYEAALNLNPDHSVALVNTARLLRLFKHDQHAELLYRRALDVSWDAGVGESLGKLYLNTDRLEEAQATFIEILDKYPDRLSTKVYLARVQLQRKKYESTAMILSSILKERPKHSEALLQLSLLYAYTNRTEEALVVATSASEDCSGPPTICAHLLAQKADMLKIHHSTEAARESYEAALELDGTLSYAHVNLGVIFHSGGDHIQAWHHYITAHSHDPTNALLLENMEKLRKSNKYNTPPPLNCITLS